MNFKLRHYQETMIAADAHAYAVAKDNPPAEIFLWLVIIGIVAIIAHALYRFINRP